MVFQWETNDYVLFYFELCDCFRSQITRETENGARENQHCGEQILNLLFYFKELLRGFKDVHSDKGLSFLRLIFIYTKYNLAIT